MKVLERRLNLGDDVLQCVGSTYKFGYDVVTAAAGSSHGRAVTKVFLLKL